jgi:hypothetical protein
MDKGVFVSRAEAESTTLKELLEHHMVEVTPLKKGAACKTNRLRTLMRLNWEHIDLNHRTAHLPDTTNGEPRTVP